MSATVDFSEMRNGDEVTVRGKIAGVGMKFISVEFETASQAAQITTPLSAIATHTPRPRVFAVGQKVTTRSYSVAEIRAISDDALWVIAPGMCRPETILKAEVICIREPKT